MGSGVGHDSHVAVAVHEVLVDLFGPGVVGVQAHLGKAGQEPFEMEGERVEADRVDRFDAQGASDGARMPDGALGLAVDLQDLPRTSQEFAACLRQGKTVLAPVDELGAKPPFKEAELLADGRLGDVVLSRRFRETPRVDEILEDLEEIKVEARAFH